MSSGTTTAVIEQQLRHASVRDFTNEPIAQELLEQLIRAGQSAATSSFIQAYSVIRVTRPSARKTIAQAAGGQAWIEKAAEFLVFCADLRRINAACQRAGQGPLKGYTEHSVAAIVDTALVAQNVLLAAESVGLGGVFIGGIRNNPQVIVEELEIPELVVPLFGMCLGWPRQTVPVKPRMPTQLIFHQDTYRDPSVDEIAAYDAVMGTYYASRASNAKQSDWTKATAAAMQGKKREHMLAFFQQRGLFRR